MRRRLLPLCTVVLAGIALATLAQPPRDPLAAKYADEVRPLLKKYCLDCHSTKAKKGSLDLERFATLDQIRKEPKPWLQTVEMLEAGEMPPKESKRQPTADERKQFLGWVREFLDGEARARAGDPGYVPLRRLSNAEYDHTIRDLTGVDLRPTREFPADGAGGEGFTNAAEALTDVSPALLTKYLNAAKTIAEHAVLLPDGVRFSPGRTRRDWTDESLARLRAFYEGFAAGEGQLPLRPYLLATVRHRVALEAKTLTVADVARREKLNAKYLGVLWDALTATTPSYPLDDIRARWRTADEKGVDALVAEVAAWQAAVWTVGRIGSYIRLTPEGYRESPSRQLPNDPPARAAQAIRVGVKPAVGQSEVVLHLATRELLPNADGRVSWHQPRFEGAGKPPLLLRDYERYGAAYEIDFPTAFAHTSKYLAAAAESAARTVSAEELAKSHGLDAGLLRRWIDVLAMQPPTGNEVPGRPVALVPLTPLDEKAERVGGWPAVNGWRRKGADLPSLVTNASDKTELIPGTLPGHKVAVHPTPGEFVAVAWTSPAAGRMTVAARVAHAHNACGNGVGWWVEHRRGRRAVVVEEGAIDRGGAPATASMKMTLEKGDVLILAVDARNGDHSCDLTEVALTVTEAEKPGRVWDLAADVADSVHAGNPHADGRGTKDVWGFVRGPARAVGKAGGPLIPPASVLGRWRETRDGKLAEQVKALLSGPRPATPADRQLYDNLVSVSSPLFQGLDLSAFRKPGGGVYGLPKDRFDDASLVTDANGVTEVRLPAALFRDREFVVEGRLVGDGDRVARFQVTTTRPAANAAWDGRSPVVTAGAGHRMHLAGLADFRRCFPRYVCFPNVVPNDEVVTLKMFHREDEPLERLFLDEAQKARLDRLWEEHRFVTQQPIAENKYLPLFIGFVTQDQPKEMLTFFEGQRGTFAKRATAFEAELDAAAPKHLEALCDIAGRAFRRPLTAAQRRDLHGLYHALRKKGVGHDEAFRGVLAKVLVSPAFLFRVETAPAGEKPGYVDDWELATRLSYFLTSSHPDAELRQVAAEGKLRDPKILADQAARLLRDDRVRALAVEFGTQWIHVRGFDEHNEKNEALFPTFDAALRKAIYEESILFFQDLFQGDRPVTSVLDASHTFLNDALAKHYGIPDVVGSHWRRVEGVRKHGRGGILGLASVQAKQAGASRTSPVLRGNWVVETLLGEKLPRPPANVPQLPEVEGQDKLTVRQLVEKHASTPACAVCHVRIDPFGFALERYDPIGRRRDKDLGGLPVDTKAKLRDGTAFDGIDGLRDYLLTKKKDVIVRQFCQKLLGYALGRSATLSDGPLLDTMVAELNKSDGRVSAAVLAVVRSQQFRMIRGRDVPTE